jgi:hypothetical protein
MRPGLLLGLVLALCGAVPAGPAEPVVGDFNQDQRLGLDDLALLRAALGGADLLYDLNEDGRVDLEDFFSWADLIGSAPVVAVPADTASFPMPALADTAALGTAGDSLQDGAIAADTAAPARPDSLPAVALPADTASLAPSWTDSVLSPALPDSAVVSVVPDSAMAPLPADTTAPPAVLLDTTAQVPALIDSPAATQAPALPDSALVEEVPADTAAQVPALPDSALSPSPVRLPANMDLGRISAGTLLPATPDPGVDSAAGLPGPIPPVPLLPADSTGIPSSAPRDSAVFVPPLVPDTALPPQPLPPTYYAIATTPRTTAVWLTGYTIVLHNVRPFGIASLRLAGQPVDFVHPELPLGDWEWFWFAEPGQPQGRAAIKLLETDWETPQVERGADKVVVRFRRQDVLRPGVEVEVAYHLEARRPEFTVEYRIANHSGRALVRPYLMVGFPGFANQQWVVSVANSLSARTPSTPFANFQNEALALGKPDYLLLRQDLDLVRQEAGELRGKVSLGRAGQTYTVETALVSAAGLSRVYAAHTNKPRYLTSHLYAYLKSLANGQSQSVAVRYTLTKEAAP